MAAPTPVLMVHRATSEIGGNCIELTLDGHRLVLDAGSRLDAEGVAASGPAVPPTLDLMAPIDGLVITHPHQDHYGLLRDLPPHWPVWSGAASEVLIRMTASLSGAVVEQRFQTYRPHEAFAVGPFTITPYLTDHSAFDAHMLLVEVGGKRILYSGDFRRVGRKAALVDRLMTNPPPDVDVLLLEGTTLGRAEAFPTESALEDDFVALFRRIPGRVFVTWSAQNIDRTVTIYRACKKACASGTSSKKSYVNVTDSMTFSSDSLSHSPATNFTGHAPAKAQRRSVVPSRSCCTMSRLRL
jgi:ribonuclease J